MLKTLFPNGFGKMLLPCSARYSGKGGAPPSERVAECGLGAAGRGLETCGGNVLSKWQFGIFVWLVFAVLPVIFLSVGISLHLGMDFLLARTHF